jgi:membrane peptidoglycan carboxypeptidase
MTWTKPLLAKLAAVVVVTGALVASSVAAIAVPISWLGEVGSGTPQPLDIGDLEQRSYVYAADGSLMAGLHGEFNRQPIPLDQVPEHVIQAILAVEDTGFYSHDGVNVRGMLRALRANVNEGGVAEGGSTVTQQLVKLLELTPEQTLERKVQEVVLALRLEREKPKEEILALYLNAVYFGNHAYGIQAASETYFGKPPSEINAGEAALLAALIRNPTSYNPVRYPERAKERRRLALERMEEVDLITADEVRWYDAVPVPTQIQDPVPEPRDYFIEVVKEQLLNDPRLGETPEERQNAVFQGGLRVYTTFDPRAQQLALEARNSQIPGGTGVFDIGPDPETGENRQGTAAVVTIEHATGAVRALVGGPGFENYQYDLATENPRQGGSSHKTFVLTSLMEQGFSPNDSVDGISPCRFTMPEDAAEDFYEVENFDRDGGSVNTITEQTIRSSNCAYVRLGQIAGIPNVIDVMGRLGINTENVEAVPSLPLGAEEVTPLQMAGAYAGLANNGVYNKPYFIERVEDRHGKVIFGHAPESRQAVSPQTAHLVTSILEKNVQSGTGMAAQLPGRQAAGKTGTAQNSADAWFVGYTGNYTTAVWMGGMGGQVPITLGGRSLTGGSYPARIWQALMAPLHEGKPVVGFTAPGPTRAPRFIEAPRTFDPGGHRPGPPPPPPGQQPPPGNDPPITLPTIPGWPPPGRGGGNGRPDDG